jgi:hypothetical protein
MDDVRAIVFVDVMMLENAASRGFDRDAVQKAYMNDRTADDHLNVQASLRQGVQQ